MAVRVRLRIQPIRGGPPPAAPAEAAAVVNSGYEARSPQLIVPAELSERLGLWPALPDGTAAVDYDTAGGHVTVYRIPQAAQVEVMVADRTRPAQLVDIVIDQKYRQVLISDELGERLGIVILQLKRGTWRFSDEMVERPSEPAQQW